MSESGSVREFSTRFTSRGFSPASSAAPLSPDRRRISDNGEPEVSRLQKQNFNLKLRIYYLEERLSKLVSGSGEGDATSLQEELINQKMLVEEKTRELEERNVLLIKARNAIETLQSDLEFSRMELENARFSDKLSEAGSIDSVSSVKLSSKIRNLERKLAEAVDRDVHEAELEVRDAEIRRLEGLLAQGDATSTYSMVGYRHGELEELSRLREQVVSMARELGEARGRCSALEKQAHQVAQLEADEIASLQQTLHRMKREFDEEHQLCNELSTELSGKTALLGEADRAIKTLEDRLMMVQRDKDELQRTWHSEKARWDSAAKDKELAIQLSKTADLEMRRDISELTGQLHAMKGACRTWEERESKCREDLELARSKIRELEREVSQSGARTTELVEEERRRHQQTQADFDVFKSKARDRELRLKQQLRHWEHHLKSMLGEFVRGPDLPTSSRRGSSVFELSRVEAVDSLMTPEDEGEGAEANYQLLELVRQLPSIRRWFESRADEVLAQAQGIFAKLQQQLNHHGATLSGVRDKLQPTLMTAKAAISARQIAESKAEDALVTRGSLSAQLEAQSQAVTRLQADLQRTREEASLLAKRNDSLAEINCSLALEVEEKRNVIESVIVEKERLLEDSERLRQAVLQRDGQLAEYMSQLTSQLQVVGGAKPLSSSTGGARSLFSVTQPSATEQHAVLIARVRAVLEDVSALVKESGSLSSQFTRLVTVSGALSTDESGSISRRLLELLQRNDVLASQLKDLTEGVNRSIHFPAASALQSSLHKPPSFGDHANFGTSGIKSIRTTATADGGVPTSVSGARPVSTPQLRVDRFMPGPVEVMPPTPMSERAVSAATWLMSARRDGQPSDRFVSSGQQWRGDATRDADNVSVSTLGETWTLK